MVSIVLCCLFLLWGGIDVIRLISDAGNRYNDNGSLIYSLISGRLPSHSTNYYTIAWIIIIIWIALWIYLLIISIKEKLAINDVMIDWKEVENVEFQKVAPNPAKVTDFGNRIAEINRQRKKNKDK